MDKLSLHIKLMLCLFITAYTVQAQTASSTKGCAELKVQFTAPTATSYFWVFGDGPSSVSNLQNPEHSYIQPGDYVAQLFDQANGTQVGQDILITVYPPIEFEINADVREGCAPLSVNFTSTLTQIHPDIDVADIVWTFGDGSSASGANVSYTYPQNGVYTVSVKVTTVDEIKCDEPVIFPDYIRLEGDAVTFNLNQTSTCDIPDEFVFQNTTDVTPGSTFLWDFGNGQTSTEEGPHTITYSAAGLFFPTLTITSPSGCASDLERTISLGAPVILPTYPDTICFGAEVLLNQATFAQRFEWDFTGAAIDTSFSPIISNLKRPTVIFTETGLQTFTMTATAADGCISSETLSIFVLQPDASYTVGPEVTCTDPIFVGYSALETVYSSYIFSSSLAGGTEVESDSPTGSALYDPADRESFYINRPDSILTRLIVESVQGCLDTAFQTFVLRLPEACFIPDVVKGCIPFEVNFSDQSFSEFDITTRAWDFGDGQSQIYNAEDTLISHVYNTTGIHQVVLNITDIEGCKDVSRPVEIIAIDKIELPGAPGLPCPPVRVCVEEDLTVLVNSGQLDVHLESDEGRFDHCWKEDMAVYAYPYPGVYPLDYTYEFLTIYIDSVITGCIVTVEGARSELNYAIDCATPFDVALSGEQSINADQYAWYVEDQLISNEMSLTHTFDQRGEYMVYLDTRQDGVGCMHRDSALIHITDVVAVMNISDKSCASEPTLLDASGSQDPDTRCHGGYTWLFEDQRPRETSSSTLSHMLLPGFQMVTLIVEDINGCMDTISNSTNAFALEADFTADTLICLPSDASILNLTTSDTTIMSYTWDFGGSVSTDENPNHLFEEADFDNEFLEDTITVTLAVVDALGCVDTTTFLIDTYDIFSSIMMDNGPDICENEMITFDAADYIVDGSFLTYEWDFGVNGSSTEDNPSVIFTESGEQLVTLTFTEDATGCQGMLDTVINVILAPEAGFISDQDSVEFICFPEQFQFTNTTTGIDNGFYLWDFGNGSESVLENPLIPFDKGTWDVQLIVITPEACADTVTRTYTLVGPEGNFTVDKDVVCPGEPITFTLQNSIDVSTFTWDFGDGVQVDNMSPVTHTYDPSLGLDAFNPTLILRSDESGCELIQDLPIDVSSITADIEVDSLNCPGELTLFTTFENPQALEWNIDGQIITGTTTPTAIIDSEADSILVTLFITDDRGCEVERTKTVPTPISDDGAIIQFPNVFSPNGDGNNDFFNIVYDPIKFDGEITVTDFRVYNRWGEVLYNNATPTTGWDGVYDGERVPSDVYGYYIEVSIDGCSTRNKKGNVTVIDRR